MRLRFAVAILAALLLASPFVPIPAADANGRVPEFIPIGDLSGGTFRSVAHAVSGDGEVVVGQSTSGNGPEAFRWTKAGGMTGLGDLPGESFSSGAYAVNTDGDVIVGSSQSAASGAVAMEAFRWTETGGMVGLGDLPGSFYASSARGVSGDGAVVAGHSASLATLFQAMRWTSGTGMEPLPDLPKGTVYCVANAVSRDGTAIVGQGKDDEGSWGVRWEEGLPGRLQGFTIGVANPGGNALDCSADGMTVVGLAQTGDGTRAVRWLDDGSIQTLGDFGGAGGGVTYSIANACSADGSVIVGTATTSVGPEAFVWTEADGMRRVTDALADLRVSVPEGWRLFQAFGVSDDGTVITGSGLNPDGDEEGWVVILGDPPEVEPQGLLITKVKVKIHPTKPDKSSVSVSGQCDQGIWLGNDLTKPLSIEVGAMKLVTGALVAASNGRSFRYRGDGVDIKLMPNKKGSSATKFRFTYKGGLGGQVATTGDLTFGMRSEWIIADGTVSLENGKFGWTSRVGPGVLMAPLCHLVKATVKLGAENAKQLKLTASLAPGGKVPAAAPDVVIEFRGWTATVRGQLFQRESWGYSFRGDEEGVTALDLDYLKGESLVLTAKEIDLGPFAPGSNNIEMSLTIGGDTREMTVRVVRRGKTVTY